jgi:hypothetical protein
VVPLVQRVARAVPGRRGDPRGGQALLTCTRRRRGRCRVPMSGWSSTPACTLLGLARPGDPAMGLSCSRAGRGTGPAST